MFIKRKIASFGYYSLDIFSIFLFSIVTIGIIVNNLELLNQGIFYSSSICFLLMFAISFLLKADIAIAFFIFLLPLLPTVDRQLSALTGLTLPHQALSSFDLVAGFLCAILLKNILFSALTKSTDNLRVLAPPRPISLALVAITFSAVLGISRNAWSSAAALNFSSIFFNLVNFRYIGWLEDFRPLTDWVAYVIASGVVVLVLNSFKREVNLNLVFRPIMAGLFLSSCLAIAQSQTGVGVIQKMVDKYGFAAFGFQPDIHSFAGYMLLGALGLWGFYFSTKSKVDRCITILVILASWVGLVLSLSRASIAIGLVGQMFIALIFISNKRKNITNFKIYIALLFFCVMIYLVYFFNYYFLPTRVIEFLDSFVALSFRSNFANINEVLSERPVLFLNALRMWAEFPIFGVGQSNFYHLFPFFNIEKIGNGVIINGENAHNYFLQTLAESGLIGVIAFCGALFTPFFLIKDKYLLYPASIALLSLFLGNIYAHSFLVRENLFIAAVFLGVNYSYIPVIASKSEVKRENPAPFRRLFYIFAVSIVTIAILALGVKEVYLSYMRFPFERGIACFVNRPLSLDWWSSGLYEIQMPEGAQKIKLQVHVARSNIAEIPLHASFQLLDSNDHILSSAHYIWESNGPKLLETSLMPGEYHKIRAVLKLSSCFTPRNMGESIDGRRLGVRVDDPIIY